MKPIVRTKWSAHIVSAILAGVAVLAVKRHLAAALGDLSRITPDDFIVAALSPSLTFAFLFCAGHFLMRASGWNARLSYTALGSFSLVVAAGIWTPLESIEFARTEGFVSIIVVLLLAIGATVGFLHIRSVGFEHDDDESIELEKSVQNRAFKERMSSSNSQARNPVSGTASVSEQDDEIGLIEAGGVEFFDGPLQVSTSTNAAVTAAMAGALAHTFYTFLVGVVFSGTLSLNDTGLLSEIASGEILSSIAFAVLLSFVICMIILPPAILGLHKLLKARGRSDMATYVKYGAVTPILVGLAMLFVGILLTHWFILPLAVAMGAYHRLAGLEPADLPEDIEVKDRRTLVGANHVRRRTRRIVG